MLYNSIKDIFDNCVNLKQKASKDKTGTVKAGSPVDLLRSSNVQTNFGLVLSALFLIKKDSYYITLRYLGL